MGCVGVCVCGAGACVKRPNLCIVTEFVQRGALKDILHTPSIKLVYQLKLRILQSAAMGIHHLHSLDAMIIHRDLKPSNLLVRHPHPPLVS
jgi:serine/threonine protein kinase